MAAVQSSVDANLLGALLSPENALRASAEGVYTAAANADPSSVLQGLVAFFCGARPTGDGQGQQQQQQQQALRVLCVVLARQIVRNKWDLLTPAVVEGTLKRELLLLGFQAEPDQRIREKLCSIITSLPPDQLGVFAATLLPHLIELLQSRVTPEGMHMSVLFLVEKLAEFSYASVFEPRMHLLHKMIQKISGIIADQQQGPLLKMAACRAAVSILASSPNPRDYAELGHALPKVILECLVAQNDESVARASLESLSLLAESCFWAFEPNFGPTCVSLLAIAGSPTLASQTRCLATQILTDLFTKRGKLIIQDEQFLRQVLQVLMKMQCEDEEFEHEWEEQQQIIAEDPTMLSSEDILFRSWPGMRSYAIAAMEALVVVVASLPSSAKNKKESANNSLILGFLAIYFEFIKLLLGSSTPREQHAGLTSIAIVLGPCSKKIWGHLKEIINGSCQLLTTGTTCVRVQYAAAACLHEVFNSESLAKVVTRTMHGLVMPVLIATLLGATAGSIQTSDEIAVVKCTACLTVSRYCEQLAPDYVADSLMPYLDELVRALAQLISTTTNSKNIAVQVNAMNALASIAKTVKADFGRFYGDLMPGIKIVLSSPGSGSMTPLRHSAMLCIATIAEAVGKAKFMPDAPDVMTMLFSGVATEFGSGANVPNLSEKADELQALFEFCKRASVVLKEEFIGFLPHILPVLVFAAAADLGIQVEATSSGSGGQNGDEDDDDDDDNLEQDSGNKETACIVQRVRGVGAFKIKANIFAIQLRLAAIECIDGLADALGGSFLPFVEPCASVVVPAITEKGVSSINIKAAEASASLLHCACMGITNSIKSNSGEEQKVKTDAIQRFLVTLITILTKCLHETSYQGASDGATQDADERRIGFMTAIERCTRICFYSGSPSPVFRLPSNMIAPFVATLMEAFKLSVTRRSEEMNRLMKLGYDEEDSTRFAAEVEEVEIDLCKEIVDAIGWVLKVSGPEFLPVFDQLIDPLFSKLLHPSLSAPLHHNALCLYSDVVQYCGPGGAQKYANFSLTQMMHFCLDEDPLVRLVCVYAIGVISEHAPDVFSARAPNALELLLKAAQEAQTLKRNNNRIKGSQDPEDGGNDQDQVMTESGECAVSTIGKICRLYNTKLGEPLLTNFLTFWVQSLPLHHDEEEVKFFHDLLATLVNELNPVILAQAPHVVRVFGDILVGAPQGEEDSFELASQTTLQAIPTLLRQIAQSSLQGERFRMVRESLDPKSNNAIQQVVGAL